MFLRFKTVKVADWPKFLSVVLVVGGITVVGFRTVHWLLSLLPTP